jgi:hypothetical protein
MACSDVLSKPVRTRSPKGLHEHLYQSNTLFVFPKRIHDLVAPGYTREILQGPSLVCLCAQDGDKRYNLALKLVYVILTRRLRSPSSLARKYISGWFLAGSWLVSDWFLPGFCLRKVRGKLIHGAY